MMKLGFDSEKYIRIQSEHIKERIAKFGNKLYLELGGKLFDDFHASRVLPGFAPDSKVRMLMELRDQAEIVIVINASDIESNRMRADIGITYDKPFDPETATEEEQIAAARDFVFYREEKPLGSGGSLSLIRNRIKSTFVVASCDIVLRQDFPRQRSRCWREMPRMCWQDSPGSMTSSSWMQPRDST